MRSWAGQNPEDRRIGEAWERRFCAMATELGLPCHKPGPPETWWPRAEALPDRKVSVGSRPEWHEIKHKRPSREGNYGLEAHRLRALVHLAEHTGEAVLYTIHDWALAGGFERDQNDLEDWLTADVLVLRDAPQISRDEELTYYRSGPALATIVYWNTGLWVPLGERWGITVRDKRRRRPAPVPQGELWPDGINPYVSAERRRELQRARQP